MKACTIGKVILIGIALLGASVVFADIPAPDRYECANKQVGDACRMEWGQGVCANAICSQRDYSHGIPPHSTEVPCVRCVSPTEKGGATGVASPAGR